MSVLFDDDVSVTYNSELENELTSPGNQLVSLGLVLLNIQISYKKYMLSYQCLANTYVNKYLKITSNLKWLRTKCIVLEYISNFPFLCNSIYLCRNEDQFNYQAIS